MIVQKAPANSALQIEGEEDISSNPYAMFKYSIRTEITRKYYERRIRHFFDYIMFDLENNNYIQKRCNTFVSKASNDIKWVLDQVVKFLQFQKNRTQKGEITAATLRNFVKSIKLFCDVCDISIPWKKITRGLPRARQAANDRAPTIEEIQRLVEYPDRRIKPIVYLMVPLEQDLELGTILNGNILSPLLMIREKLFALNS